jgi:AcrR family transcriptional regulator
MVKADRRVQRTRELLQKALIELIKERGYESITIQEIVDRANIGRTAFYLHFHNKDELFISCHEAMIRQFHLGPLYPLSREELLSPQAPPEMTTAYQHLEETRALLSAIFQGKDSLVFLRQMLRDWNAQEIEANLQSAFIETDSLVPFEVLANYLAGAQISLLHWWLEKRRPYTPQELAQSFHRLQRAAIRDAFGLVKDST